MPENAQSDDVILPFHIETAGARGRLVRLSGAISTILSQHAYPDAVSSLLGEAITLTAMLGASLKIEGGSFILQTRSEGPVKFLVAHYHTPGSLRGYASFDADTFAKATNGATASVLPNKLLGDGHFVMTIDPGPGMERYQGVVALEGSLVGAASHYFRQSEQIPTFLRVAVAKQYLAGKDGAPGTWSWRAGGLMVQKLTDEGGAAIAATRDGDDAEQEDAWERARIFASTVKDDELLDAALTPEVLLYRLFNEERVRVFHQQPLVAFCQCSEDRVQQMLKRFSPEEIADMVLDGRIEVTCEFCNRRYQFDAATLHAETA
jgi:molecular chaperone Hsp33